jgi:hypothetical protein
LTAGITAVLAGVLYSWGGRTLAYSACAAAMALLTIGAWLLAGPRNRALRGVVVTEPLTDQVAVPA